MSPPRKIMEGVAERRFDKPYLLISPSLLRNIKTARLSAPQIYFQRPR